MLTSRRLKLKPCFPDITTGARGIIADIKLSRDKPPLDDKSPLEGAVGWKFLPECVLVKLDHTCTIG